MTNPKEWFCTDPDCCQYCQQLDDWTYVFIEIRSGSAGSFFVCKDVINLCSYTFDELWACVSSFYPSMEAVVHDYGFNRAFQIIAECVFENFASHDVYVEQDSYEAAENYIKKIITKN